MSEKVRKTIIAGNWKMNKLRNEAQELATAIVAGTKGRDNLPDILLCPPFTSLDIVVQTAKDSAIQVGAQNVEYHDAGAFTGEVSPPMLIDAGVTHVIIGHSERRQFFGETNQTVPLKVKAALAHKLTPIVCVGELLDERENDLTDPVVKRQVGAALNGLTEDEVKSVILAYEPVWAIGTGQVCESKEAARVVGLIRKTLTQFFQQDKDGPDMVPILYGGSMNAKNAEELLAQDEIDGGLIGGASLKADEFLEIVNHACKRPRLSAAKA